MAVNYGELESKTLGSMSSSKVLTAICPEYGFAEYLFTKPLIVITLEAAFEQLFTLQSMVT